jgi:hypothetical protein
VALQGGVLHDIQQGVAAADEAALAAAQSQSMSAENDRRMRASQRPGHGAGMHLEQSPAAAGVGISDVPMPAAGLGYDVAPVVAGAQVAAYSMPSYADGSVGGLGFTAGQEAPIRVFVGSRSAGHADGVTFVSPPAAPKPSLLARVLGKLRRG